MNDYADAYVRYFESVFHVERDYFECHEVLEEFWKEHPDDPQAEAYVALIQIAVASYHQRRGNLRGAVKMFNAALERLARTSVQTLGLDGTALKSMLAGRLQELERGTPFSDINLPITDTQLLERCKQSCSDPDRWGTSSEAGDTFLLHKHTMRDRSGVVEEREKQRQIKASRRSGGSVI